MCEVGLHYLSLIGALLPLAAEKPRESVWLASSEAGLQAFYMS